MSLSLEEERKLQEKCEEELKLYENMFRIALEQKKAINLKETKALLSLLNKRKRVINKIEAIENEIASLKKTMKESKDSFCNNKIASLMEKIASLMEKTLRQDVKNQSLLKNFIKNISQNLEHIQTGRALHNAYGKHSFPESRFMNYKT
ncbi:flagellar export chaperone FlgN [Candidatus Aerophobetes bacterium]|nr:flagellar export chaperone FlgN [Candidatus Aerophobetes bacterium]